MRRQFRLVTLLLLTLLGMPGRSPAQGRAVGAVLASSGPDQPRFDPQQLPAELTGGAAALPLDLLLAIEDAHWPEVDVLLPAQLEAHPEALELRALKLATWSARDPASFLARPQTLADPGAPLADRFEAAHALALRIDLERTLYRGDREESAEAFIARLEGLAALADQELEQLEARNSTSARIVLTRTFLARLRGRLNAPAQQHLRESLLSAGPWADIFWSTALEGRLLSSDDDLRTIQERCTSMMQPTPHPLAGLCQRARLSFEARSMNQEVAIHRYAETEADLPDSVFLDDLQLARARLQSDTYADSELEAAVILLTPLVEGPWRNTSLQATVELSGALRRLSRHQEAATALEAFHQRFPLQPYRLDRDLARAYLRLERLPEALQALQRSVDGLRGKGGDYLLMSATLRRMPPVNTQEWRTRRAEALKLADFAQAASEEEARVVGWVSRQPPPMIAFYVLLAQLNTLGEHTALFPTLFAATGLGIFVETLALALGLMVLVSFPRISMRLWPWALLAALLGLYPPVLAMAAGLPSPLDPGPTLAWVVQALARLFLLISAGLVLGIVAGVGGLRLRRLTRGGEGARSDRSNVWLVGLALLLLLPTWELVSAERLTFELGYLERLPSLLSGAELGATGTIAASVGRAAATGLELFHVLHEELLARGLILGALAWLWRHQGWGRAGAVAGAALVSGVLAGLSHEPAPMLVGVGIVQGLALGWLRLRAGLDGVCAVRLGTVLLAALLR